MSNTALGTTVVNGILFLQEINCIHLCPVSSVLSNEGLVVQATHTNAIKLLINGVENHRSSC